MNNSYSSSASAFERLDALGFGPDLLSLSDFKIEAQACSLPSAGFGAPKPAGAALGYLNGEEDCCFISK